jgi:hypothetical protein
MPFRSSRAKLEFLNPFPLLSTVEEANQWLCSLLWYVAEGFWSQPGISIINFTICSTAGHPEPGDQLGQDS